MSAPAFDWEEYLELAGELAGRRGDVGAERSAISRAYYAAFHKAAEYLTARGERLTFTGDDHTFVWDWFFQPGASAMSLRIGSNGHRLRRARRRADYDPSPFRNLSSEARTAVALAQAILADLPALR